MMAHYLIDVLVSVGLVVVVGWAFQATVGDTYIREALTAQSQLYQALSRFTPDNLLASYLETIQSLTRDLTPDSAMTDGLSSATGRIFAAAVGVLAGIFLAAPHTLVRLYQGTSGVAGWVVLAGFGLTILVMLGWLLASRLSLLRVMAAAAVSPLAVSVVFLSIQMLMLLLFEAFFWLTWFAPFAAACPVLCTLYWIAFPGAEHGAAASFAHALGRLLPRG